jgi:HAD superfamily hydrolase (TIGR01490 family)
MACILVDVDGTLIGGRGSEARFILRLVRRGALGPAALARSAAFILRWLPRHGRHVLKKNKTYLADLAVSEVEAIAADFVRSHIAPLLRREMLSRLDEHRAAGDRLVLLTGTPDFIAAPLTRLVGADAYIASRCAVRDGRFTSDPPPDHPFGRDKLRLGHRAATDAGATLADCAAYADSIYDLPLLAAVGRPVCVHPDRKLERIAVERGWEILAPRPRLEPLRRMVGARQRI